MLMWGGGGGGMGVEEKEPNLVPNFFKFIFHKWNILKN